MRKECFIYLFYSLLFAIVFLLSGCGGKEPGRYYNKHYKFSIKLPHGWEIEEGDGIDEPLVSAVTEWENDDDWFRDFMGVFIDELDAGEMLEDYFQMVIENSEKSLAHFEIQDSEDIVINNCRVKKLVSTYTIVQGKVLILSYFIVKGRKGCIIACDTEPTKFDMYKYSFEQAARSFRFE